MRRALLILTLLVPMIGCSGATGPDGLSIAEVRPADRQRMTRPAVPGGDPTEAGFLVMARQLEPIIEQECAERNRLTNCDFTILIAPNPNLPPNAFQTIRNGKPLIVFTKGIIRESNNMDELAFVLGHEAAHHIAGHLTQTQLNAAAGAIIAGGVTAIAGRGPEAVQQAQRVGFEVGSRRYSRDFELEADALGTIITWQAGFDPVRGADFFNRIPDPGDQFLGTHPPNAQRVAIVNQTMAKLR